MFSKYPRFKVGVAEMLGVPERHLNFLLYGLSKNNKQYTEIDIPKKSGGVRHIDAPVPALKMLQRKFSDILYEKAQIKSCAYAFCRDKSKGIKGNAERHKKRRWIVNIDLVDFFPTIHFGRIRGLFLSSPFNCSEEVATIFAQLACNKGHLAQGAPSSPIISNLICRRLDNRLIDFAKTNHLTYTRYADDITFSSNLSEVPENLGKVIDEKFVLSEELYQIIEKENGFFINEDKVHLMTRNNRQVVTGLIVNEKLNISRHYIRQVRAMLHAWKKYGIRAASNEHYSRYRIMDLPNPEARFSSVVQGKINYIGNIRGKDDPIYARLCQVLWELEPKAKLKVSYTPGDYDAVIFCEGVSDRFHLSAALTSFKENGEFTDLNVMFYEYKKSQNVSNSELRDLLNHKVKWSDPQILEIYLFDRDDKGYYDMENTDGSPICHKKNIYSLLLPVVPHRTSPRVCIEHFYTNEDLLQKDSNGRRIFLSTEFDCKTAHCEYEDVTTTMKKALSCDYEYIIDKQVLNKSEKNVAMSKVAFAKNVFNKQPPFDKMDFSHFSLIFEKLRGILISAKKIKV